MSYECRLLFFRALHTLVERTLCGGSSASASANASANASGSGSASGAEAGAHRFVRLGRWFVQPDEANAPPLADRCAPRAASLCVPSACALVRCSPVRKFSTVPSARMHEDELRVYGTTHICSVLPIACTCTTTSYISSLFARVCSRGLCFRAVDSALRLRLHHWL